MREILFRGRGISKEWFYGLPHYARNFIGDPILCIVPLCDDGGSSMEDMRMVDDETLGQFTGLLDKNGKKIFEGDILEGHYDELFPDSKVMSRVFMGETGWMVEEAGFVGTSVLDSFFLQYNEVAGNIHDNPGLMEMPKEV